MAGRMQPASNSSTSSFKVPRINQDLKSNLKKKKSTKSLKLLPKESSGGDLCSRFGQALLDRAGAARQEVGQEMHRT